MKKVLALVMCLAMVLALGGCSLFTGGGESDTGNLSAELKITDEFTHKDPEGLEYAQRYSYYSGDTFNKDLADMFKEMYDVTPTAEYIVIYADKDDVALEQYTYIVMASEEDAQKFDKAGDEQGTAVDVFGNVTLQKMDKQLLADTIDSFIAMNVLDSKSAKGWAEEQKEMDFLIDYNPQ